MEGDSSTSGKAVVRPEIVRIGTLQSSTTPLLPALVIHSWLRVDGLAA